ncbi:MAG: transcriptional regulator with XRE-family HTH domain [Paraglaciecola sp.]|jgi:transcriptional regulator with XRE-family HTH domain
MTLGKKLKTLRAEHNLSQPELAEKIGIEQSYLSKLENDKSVPSNEIFNHILQAFDLTLKQFVSGFVEGAELDRLKQISDVEQYFGNQQKFKQNTQRKFLYLSSLLIVLATTVFFIGYSKHIFYEIHYQYESKGIILGGESEDVFRSWRSLMEVEAAGNADLVRQRGLEMTKRQHETVLLSPIHKGKHFILTVDGGKRKYYYDKPIFIKQPINAWLQVFGVFLFSAGIMGFVLERRLFKSSL